MKKFSLLFSLVLLSGLCARAQTTTVVTNGPTFVYITNVVQITYITNITVTTTQTIYEDKTLHILTDTNINPYIGERLGAQINKNITFNVGSFPTNYYQIEFNYYNPNGNKMDFISSRPIVWMNGPAPTSNVRGTILFADLFGELRATQ